MAIEMVRQLKYKAKCCQENLLHNQQRLAKILQVSSRKSMINDTFNLTLILKKLYTKIKLDM